ncbi:MAG: MucBP domain-containing protein [Lactococcus raffinolactis]|jgi:LPXTG-motif cell wall-anchored protein|uniref:MucBP domain-containing protein n=1 Tax=Pseudolactococcus raffinolactis TaxID=1366 RepID=UPI001485C86F|nr:MucBP domain-containing protein [Lactococcus raffinolactis]MCH4161548.1 MucBP domain-containing protein [Lactococcus raffinolactis]
MTTSIVSANSSSSKFDSKFSGLLRSAENIDSWMPDKNLQKVIVECLGLNNVDEITKELLGSQHIHISDSSTNLFGQITDFTGLEYANGVNFSLGSDTSSRTFDSVNDLLSSDIKEKASWIFSGDLKSVFPNGIDCSKFNSYLNVGIDPHNTWPINKVFSLNQNNYTSFFLSFSDAKIFNAPFTDTNFMTYASLYIGNPYPSVPLHYNAEVQNSGIKFTLDPYYSVDYSKLVGQTFVNTPGQIQFPDGPFCQIHFSWESNVNNSNNLNVNASFSITFGYVASDLTVKYQDISGNKIADFKTVSGNVGDAYDVSTDTYKQNINGYTFKEVQGQSTGTLSDQGQTVTYVYTKNPVEAKPLTVRYHDTASEKIADSKNISGNIGDIYDVSTDEHKLDIDGHTFKEVQGQTIGILTDKEQVVTYVYTKNPIKSKVLTVKYQDTADNEIATAKTISGNVGDAYDVSTDAYKQVINGYTFKEVKGETIGKLSDKEQTVTYVYGKTSEEQAKEALPNTGDSNNIPVMLVGISLFLLSLKAWLFKQEFE